MTEVPVITELPAPGKSVLKKFGKYAVLAVIAATAATVVYLKVTSSDDEETVNEPTS